MDNQTNLTSANEEVDAATAANSALSDNTDRAAWLPVRLDPDNLDYEIASLNRSAGSRISVADQYEAQLEELFLLRHPQYRFNRNYQDDFDVFLKSYLGDKPMTATGEWFYFPWLGQIVHYLPDALHQELRTGRNRNLITAEEQAKYYEAKIGVLGMSVGSHVALTIAMTGGGGGRLKLADPDVISGSNLNRIRAGFQSVGLGKTIAVARQIAEMNPYGQIELYEDGLTEDNIGKFLSEPRLDILVEEMDDPYLKIKVRYAARALGIPVVMAADNGDNTVVDVERYDLDRNLPVLNGVVGDVTPEQFKSFAAEELPRIIARMAGAPLATARMQESVFEVGKSLYTWPQLGNAATLCGAALAYLARRIVLKEDIKSGRYEVNLDSIFEFDYHSAESTFERKRKRDVFLRKLGLADES